MGTAVMRATATTRADVTNAWSALTDVGSWPRWTPSMTMVTRLDDGPLRVGSRARVKQPGLPMLTWQVDGLRDREAFTWSTSSPGVRTTGVHRLATNPDGTTQITLEIEQRGPLAGMVGALLGRRTRKYLGLEAAGLKAASEAGGA
ncbi:MAG TPA: SRPBCC family protein [Micromonosporaceae bacterium]|nr:SRPBCC family protein [Micromonosporaceae bacterium]